ncbi:MAG: hypothetical protein U5K56_10250 [Halioglobus sp.]|nr:hypothetical protein [Halioglobus sp.]
MEQDFYKGRHTGVHGIDVIVTDEAERARIHAIIFEELVNGIEREDSLQADPSIASQATRAGTDSVILGCTEIGMLLNEENAAVPPYNTDAIHREAALDMARA